VEGKTVAEVRTFSHPSKTAKGGAPSRCAELRKIKAGQPGRSSLKNVSVKMACTEIDLRSLKGAVNAILDHLIEDLRISSVTIDESSDAYWHCPIAELYDLSKKPIGMDVGKLSDDSDFIELVERGQSGDVSYNLVHIAPLLRYIGETIRK
jgi:hypothetical protein